MVQTEYRAIEEHVDDFCLRETTKEVNELLKQGWQIIGLTENCSSHSGFTDLRVHLVKYGKGVE